MPSGVDLTGFLRSSAAAGLAASVVVAVTAVASFGFSCYCCAEETPNPVNSTTPIQTNPWRIDTSLLPGYFLLPDRTCHPAGRAGFFTRILHPQTALR